MGLRVFAALMMRTAAQPAADTNGALAMMTATGFGWNLGPFGPLT